MAKITDVAKAVGVSISSVSYAFSGKRQISEALKIKILAASKELGYIPKENSLPDGRFAHLIGIFGCNLSGIGNNIYIHQVLTGIYSNLQDTDYHALFIPNTGKMDAKANISRLKKLNLHGAIVLEPMEDENYISFFNELNIPFVLIGRPGKIYELSVNYVDTDNVSLGYRSCKYMLEKGFTDIMFINGPEMLTVSEDRKTGFLLACEEHGNNINVSVENTEFSIQEAYAKVKSLYKGSKPFSAIIASSDMQAAGTIWALDECGFKCPDDVSLFCTAETYLSVSMLPHITGMDLRGNSIGERAIKLLLKLISKELILPSRIIVTSILNERESVKI